MSNENQNNGQGKKNDRRRFNRYRGRNKNKDRRPRPEAQGTAEAEESVLELEPTAETVCDTVSEETASVAVDTKVTEDPEESLLPDAEDGCVIDMIGMKDDLMSGGEDLPKEAKKPFYEVVGVKFRESGKVYYFDPNGIDCDCGSHVIVETARGLEYAVVTMSKRNVKGSEVVLPLRKLVRIATANDERRHDDNLEKETEAFNMCLSKIEEHRLEMKLVDVEYAFDNSKLLFYFTSEGRVDFRDLVKDLASVFRTRIELRQIGIRDEAKLMGGIGVCGRPFCCKTFLPDFNQQVSIKMAKEQNLSLNSSKISGACGRLMCCLRYEHEAYQEEIRLTPPVVATVKTVDGVGTVVDINPIKGTIKVSINENVKTYHRDDVTVLSRKKSEKTDNSSNDVK
jgi:cell fate regulator YaaT (PSP1 superfamily)